MNARTRHLRGYRTQRDATDWCLAVIGSGLTVIAVCFAIVQVAN